MYCPPTLTTKAYADSGITGFSLSSHDSKESLIQFAFTGNRELVTVNIGQQSFLILPKHLHDRSFRILYRWLVITPRRLLPHSKRLVNRNLDGLTRLHNIAVWNLVDISNDAEVVDHIGLELDSGLSRRFLHLHTGNRSGNVVGARCNNGIISLSCFHFTGYGNTTRNCIIGEYCQLTF